MIYSPNQKDLNMTTLLILASLVGIYLYLFHYRKELKEPQDWMYKIVQTSINSYFKKHVCRWVSVSPIIFLFDEFPPESEQARPGSFLVTAKVKIQGIEKEYSVLVDDMSDSSAQLASKKIINDIRKDVD